MTKKQLEEGDAIEILRISLAIVGISSDSRTCYTIIKVLEEIQKKGGNFSVHDAIRIQYNAEKIYKKLEVKAVPNRKQSVKESDTTKAT